MNDNTRLSDVEFLSTPIAWPVYPLCPVKNYNKPKSNGMPLLGFVMNAKPTIVFLGGLLIRRHNEKPSD